MSFLRAARVLLVLIILSIDVGLASRARAQPEPTSSTPAQIDGFSYSYANVLRIPRGDVRDLDELIRRHVTPVVEEGRGLAAGPYRLIVEATATEYRIEILTTSVPRGVMERMRALERRADAGGPHEPPAASPFSDVGSAEGGERDSRAP